jgi:hypothetical protein
VVRLKVFVEHAEPADDVAPFIAEQWVRDAVTFGERSEVGRPVVADREDGVPSPLELRQRALQLDQLRLAVRSPDRAAKEDDERAPPGAAGM